MRITTLFVVALMLLASNLLAADFGAFILLFYIENWLSLFVLNRVMPKRRPKAFFQRIS